MTLVYRPYVPRWQRIWRVLKAKPQYWMYNYTEIFFCLCFVIPYGICALTYKFYKFGPINSYETLGWNLPPYYRDHYEVRRPNDPKVLAWRVPEDYPAPFQTNRIGDAATTSWRDYAWEVANEAKKK